MKQKLFTKNSFILLLAAGFLVSCMSSNSVSNLYAVHSSTGIAQGVVKNNIIVWEDIPYALPPEGLLRWKAPRTFTDETAVIISKEGNGCLQESSMYAGIPGDGIVGQEDCLYLDVQGPENFMNNSLPVMFWIHGGGNTTGVKDYYDFSELIRRHEVIVVTINYRLGPMGWFTHPAIQDLQEGLDKTSNFGTLDIIEALHWVQKNISRFGGDSENVTIFGESAGGHNVLSLLASPASTGLFHKAISQSGYTNSFTKNEAIGLNAEGEVINELGSDQALQRYDSSSYGSIKNLYTNNPSKYGDEYQKYLRLIDGKELLAVYELIASQSFDRMPLTTRDEFVIPMNGIQNALSDPNNRKNVSVLAGSNKDELSLWLGANRYFVNGYFPLTQLIPIPKVELKKEGLYKLWVKTRSQGWKFRGVDDPLMALEQAGYDSLYSYRFDWDDQKKSFFADFPNLVGAAHGFEISFITGDFKFGPIGRYVYPKGDLRDQMEDTMMAAWTSFAKTGSPDTGKTPNWKKFNSKDRFFMKLDSDDFLALEKDMLSIEYILGRVRLSPVGTLLEKCLLVDETLQNIGDPLDDEYLNWNEGACKQFNTNKERKKIADDLIAEYGSVSVYGE